MNTKNYHQERLLCSNKHYYKVPYVLIFLLLFLPFSSLFAQQKITVNAKNSSLNKVITDLRDRYDIKLSFNDDKLARYKISINQSFKTLDEALLYLLKGLPLNFEKENGVYIITSEKPFLSSNKQLLSGRVLDGKSQESLPFSSITINGYALTTDLKGNFSYTALTDTAFRLQVSYLGYYKLDTLVNPSNNLEIKLYQNSISISEVVLNAVNSEKATNLNANRGSLKLNKSVGEYLPGSSDNAVYNLLRLQPGILAAGERANDLIIWGSYQGQTKVSFDGFTIFGLKNFNDNIGAINPLMAKDVSVKKGGYGAEQGDRVGGVVDINGVEGSMVSPSLNIGLNNLMLNASISTPLFKNTSLVFAGRQTYYNLYNDYTTTTPSNNRNGVKRLVDVTIKPDYVFKDANLKFSGRNSFGDNYFLSFFSGSDRLNSAYTTTQGRTTLQGVDDEGNTQYGVSAFYNKIWRNGSISSVNLSSSGLNTKDLNELDLKTAQALSSSSELSKNTVDEQSLKFTHHLPINKKYNLYTGFGLIQNSTSYTKDSLAIEIINIKDNVKRAYSFLESPYFFTSKFKFTPGLRLDYQIETKKIFLQPRLAATYDFKNKFKLGASWGIYRQFIAYTTLIDDDGNYKYQWAVSDGSIIPIYTAQHWVFDGSYEYHQFWINTSFYYKYNAEVTRLSQSKGGLNISYGNGRSYGLDFMIKKEFKSNAIWAAYTLSRTQERFLKKIGQNKFINEYERAPQDQRHELKFAGLVRIAPFYLSANYIYGSGFRSTKLSDDPSVNVLAYNRFDTALTYKFKAKKYKLETGISILNLFNTQNLKSSNYQRIATETATTINIYAQSVPFTPTIFLKFSL